MSERVKLLYVDPSSERRNYCKQSITKNATAIDVDVVESATVFSEISSSSYDVISVFYTEMSSIKEKLRNEGFTGETILVIDDAHDKSVNELNDEVVDDVVKIVNVSDVELLRQRVERNTSYKQAKRRLYSINESTSKLFNAETINEIAEITISTTKEIMGYEFIGVHTEENSMLKPIAATDPVKNVLGEPEIPEGEGIAWEAFNKNEVKVYSDVKKAKNVMNEDTTIQSEIAIPIGEEWLLLIGSQQINDFSPNDIAALNVLCKNTKKAIDRLEKKKFVERFKFFIELSPDIVQVVNRNGEVMYQSNASPLTEFSMPKVEGEKITDFAISNDKQVISNEMESIQENTDGVVTTTYRVNDEKTGEEIWVETRSQNFIDTEPLNGIIRVTREITDEKETKEQIKKQNKRLDQFASVVTHDLRNPLAVAQGNAGLIKERIDSTDDELNRFVTDVESSLNRMENIIQNMLSLTKSGDITGEKHVECIDEISKEAWSNVQAKEATLNIECEKKINCDKKALIQCLENLFRNSIEHGGRNVTITITDIAKGFSIKDDGEGIDEDIAESLFEMGETTDQSGTGYGLGIVKKVVDEHEWKIEVDVNANGAKFDITVSNEDRIATTNNTKGSKITDYM